MVGLFACSVETLGVVVLSRSVSHDCLLSELLSWTSRCLENLDVMRYVSHASMSLCIKQGPFLPFATAYLSPCVDAWTLTSRVWRCSTLLLVVRGKQQVYW